MRELLVIAVMLLAMGCSRSPYGELEETFGTSPVLNSKPIPSRTVVLVGKGYQGAFNYPGVFTIRLSSDAVEFAPSSRWMQAIAIPASAVAACSALDFGEGNWDTLLLLHDVRIQVSIDRAPEIVDWCWQNRIPFASIPEQDVWDETGNLSMAGSPRPELESREAYDHQVQQARRGF